ncbi:hypothetical protein D3C87_1316160 [compost metagenome]
MQVRINVVFDHLHAKGPGQLQHAARHHRCKAAAGRVVIEAIDEQPLRPVFDQHRFEHFNVRPAWCSRHLDHVDAVQPEQIEQHRITGTLHDYTVTGLEQCPHNQVESLTGPRRGHDPAVLHRDIQLPEALEYLLSQGWQSQRRAVVEQAGRIGTTDLPNRVNQIVGLAPAFRQPATAQPQFTRKRPVLGLSPLEPRRLMLCARGQCRVGNRIAGPMAGHQHPLRHQAFTGLSDT